jgi:hypothetical protein
MSEDSQDEDRSSPVVSAFKGAAAGMGYLKRAGGRLLSRSPESQARKAWERGDTLFQHRAEADADGDGRLLSKIEAEGWKLEDTQFHPETKTTVDDNGHEQTETTTYAVYLFRRVEGDGE